ncbi:MAG: mechanosensitive ion channel [bacterium]|nr:mechanosensitive ion channel [bacterium]
MTRSKKTNSLPVLFTLCIFLSVFAASLPGQENAPPDAQTEAGQQQQQSEEDFTEQIIEQLLDENPITESLNEKGSGGLREYLQRFTPASLQAFAFERLPQAARSLWEVARDFAVNESAALILQLFLIAIIAVTLRLRRKKKRKPSHEKAKADSASDEKESPAPHPGRLWLNRPLSVGIFGALAVSPLLFEEIPDAIRSLFYLIALIPALRILAPRLHKKFRRLFYIFVFVLGAHWITRSLGTAGDLFFPAGMLVMALAILILRAGTDSESRGQRLADWYGRARPGIAALFLLAAGIEAAGYTSLARFIGEGLLYSVTALPATIALVRVLHDLLLRFLDSRYGRWQPIQRRRLALQKSALGNLRSLAAIFWVLLSLAAFEVLGRLYNLLGLILGYEFKLGSFSLSAGDIAAFAFIFWFALKIASTIRSVLAETTTQRLELDRGASYALATVAQYIVIALGFFIGITAAGFDLNRLAIIAGALGVGIGLGLQDIVKNFVSGLVLLFERPITVGDFIEVDDMIGQVERIGIRSSTVRIVDGSDVIVPNGLLLSEKVRNWTLTDYKRRIDVNVGVAYGTDPKQVLQILEDAARGQEHIIPGEDPQVYFLGFGDSSLDFTVRVFTEKIELRLQIQSDLTTAIYGALNEAGIEIPFPQRDLHIRSNQAGAAPT